MVIEILHKKSTRNYHVYEELTHSTIVNPIYIKSEDIEVDGKAPRKLRMTLEEIA